MRNGFSPAPASDQFVNYYLYFLLVLVVGVTWLWPIGNSLWLDETLTYWGVNDTFAGMLFRTMHLHYFSLFFWLEWVVVNIGGTSELMLRLPSVISMGAALLVLKRLVTGVFDRNTAACALLVFASHPAIMDQASNARPYALGIFFSCLGTYFFIRWFEGQRCGDGLRFVFFSSLAVYAHLFFCLQLVPFAMASVILLCKERARTGSVISVCAGLTLFLAPIGWWTYSSYLGRSHLLSWAATPTVVVFVEMIVPKQFLKTAGICAVVGLLLKVRIRPGLPFPQWKMFLLLSLAMVPCLILFLVSRFTDMRVFVEHYLISIVPSVTILIAALIRSCESVARDWRGKVHAGAVFATIFAAAALGKFVVNEGWASSEDWRWTIKTVQARLDATKARGPVLFDSGLVEGRDLSWLSDPLKSTYVLAPLAPYPLTGEVVPLPFAMDNERAKRYCTAVLARIPTNQFILVGRSSAEEVRMERAFFPLAESRGYKGRYLFPPEGSATYAVEFRR